MLLRLAHEYASATATRTTTVAKKAAGQAHLFNRLLSGCDITTRRAGRVAQWFSDNWPADLPWPADVPRPAPAPDSAAANPPPVDDPLSAVREALERTDAAMVAGDFGAAQRHDAAAARAATALRDDGRIASVEALCTYLKLERYVYDDVVRRYAGRPEARARDPESAVGRMLSALVAAGDGRFSRRDAA